MSQQTAVISVIDPDHKRYEDLDVKAEDLSVRKSSTLFYNELVEAYNGAGVGAILLVPLPQHIRFSNLKNVLTGRGLRCGVDLLLVRMERDADGLLLPKGEQPAKIKKISENDGKLIDTYSKGEQA